MMIYLSYPRLIKIVKEEWFKTPSNNQTAKLVCFIDCEIFKNLSYLESNHLTPLNITAKQLSDCFRKPKNVDVDWTEIKKSALEIFSHL